MDSIFRKGWFVKPPQHCVQTNFSSDCLVMIDSYLSILFRESVYFPRDRNRTVIVAIFYSEGRAKTEWEMSIGNTFISLK